ncbi:retrotransposon protein, putative, ty1-copia subclass [Tanacetum coccineum]
MFVIEQPIPPAPAANSEANVLAEWNALYDAYNEVACLMLGSMTPELHRQFENYSPYDMLQELKSMFEKQAGVERFDLIQTFHACKHEEGKPVGAYVLKMKDYVEQLERLGYVLPQDLSVGLILNGLTSDFTGFVRNYNMHNMGKTIGELHAMLIEYEKGLPKKAETPQVMMIKGGKIQKANKKSLKAKGKGKANGKGKDKHGYISKPKNPKPTAKEHPAKDDTCHHCKEVGHWKRNCPVFLAELLKKKKQVGTASSSGIFTIELFAFPNKSWVYDTGCGTHVCITKQGFREARKLKQGALYLYVGNGVRAQVEAIGSFDLVLPNGLVICLDNCHYAPSITRGVVSVHRLVENGFVQCFTDFGISVSKNNVHYFNAIPSNGIYEIDMHDLSYSLAKINVMNSLYCNKEGLLKSTDDESFDQCVSCLSGKDMSTEIIFHMCPDRATDLLGLYTYDVMEFTTLRYPFGDYALESSQHVVLNMVPTKSGDVRRCEAKIRLTKLQTKIFSGRAEGLEEIQDEDTPSSEFTSEIHMEVEGFEPPQEEVILIRRSKRTHRAPECLCLNVEVEEHSLGDLNEATSYKAAIYVFILNGGAVDSKSSKKSTTAMSATEVEYIAASEAAMEAIWIRKFISGLEGRRTRHITIEDIHYVREEYCILGADKNYHLSFTQDDNLADPFTKALPNGKLTQHARSMGLRLASSFM